MKDQWVRKRDILINDKIDVSTWVVDYVLKTTQHSTIERYGLLRKKPFYK